MKTFKMQVSNRIQKIILRNIESMKSFFYLMKHNICGAIGLLKFLIFFILVGHVDTRQLIHRTVQLTVFYISYIKKKHSNFSVTLAQNRLTLVNRTNNHCVKSVSIRRFSGLYFPMFGRNTERYGAFSSNAGKYGPKNSKY